MQDGDVMVLGDLLKKDTQSSDGSAFLPGVLHSRGHKQSGSEILLVFQVQRLIDIH